jgi:hypothetical protein
MTGQSNTREPGRLRNPSDAGPGAIILRKRKTDTSSHGTVYRYINAYLSQATFMYKKNPNFMPVF